MNNMYITGRLVHSAVIKEKVGTFTIASSISKEKTLFLDCCVFETNIKLLEKYGKKGQAVSLYGYLDMRPADKEKGYPQKYTLIVKEFALVEYIKNEKVEQTTEDKSLDVLVEMKEKESTKLPDDDLPF